MAQARRTGDLVSDLDGAVSVRAGVATGSRMSIPASAAREAWCRANGFEPCEDVPDNGAWEQVARAVLHAGAGPELVAAMRETRELRAAVRDLAGRCDGQAARNEQAMGVKPSLSRLVLENRAEVYRKCAAQLRDLLGPEPATDGPERALDRRTGPGADAETPEAAAAVLEPRSPDLAGCIENGRVRAAGREPS